MALARDFLPLTMGGHGLLTTRAQAMGRFARRVEVEVLPTEAGALFLLHRAGLLALDATFGQAEEEQRDQACAICEELGGLPLALDQAGAYIEETGCSLLEYQRLFQSRRVDLLAKRGGFVEDHPLPVATTWSLSFKQMEQKNPAADLLRVCAFLAPDAIPGEIITQGCLSLRGSFFRRIRDFFSQKGKTERLLRHLALDVFAFNRAIEALRAYSLIRREISRDGGILLWVHRLVQAVLQDGMDEPDKKEWAELVVLALSATFPLVEHHTWPLCEQLVPHAKVCADLINAYGMVFSDAARLLSRTGVYLGERARYQEAEPLFLRVLSIREQEVGASHPDTARSLSNLALLYSDQGKDAEAEPLYDCAHVAEKTLSQG